MSQCPKCTFSNEPDAESCRWCGQRIEQLHDTPRPAMASAATRAEVAIDEGGMPQTELNGHCGGTITCADVPRVRAVAKSTANGAGTMTLIDAPRRSAEEAPATNVPAPATVVAPAQQDPYAAPVATRPRLVVVRGEKVNAEYTVLEGQNYIGRAADRPVDIDLEGQEPSERVWASRQHAVVSLNGGTLVIEDLTSLNGTFVNRSRVHPGQPRVLQPGDVIQVGTVQLKVLV